MLGIANLDDSLDNSHVSCFFMLEPRQSQAHVQGLIARVIAPNYSYVSGYQRPFNKSKIHVRWRTHE